jgi:hypothetical protein
VNLFQEPAEIMAFEVKAIGAKDDGELTRTDLMVAGNDWADFGLVEGLLLVGDAWHGKEGLGGFRSIVALRDNNARYAYFPSGDEEGDKQENQIRREIDNQFW